MEDLMNATSGSAALNLAVEKYLPLSPQFFCYKITTATNSTALPFKWLTNKPVSVEQ